MTRRGEPPPATARHPGPAAAARTFDDFDQFAEAFAGWDLRFRQLGHGPFRGAISLVQIDGVQLLRITLNRTMLVQGTPPVGRVTLSPVTTGNGTAIFRGERLRPGQLNVVAAGDEVNHVTSAVYDNIVMTVDRQRLARTAIALHGVDVEGALAGRVAVQTDTRACLAVNEYFAHVLRGLTLRQASPAAPEATRYLAARCVERVVGLLSGGQAPDAAARAANPRRLVFAAERMMDESLAEPLTAADLCRELDISERSLRYAFREVRGVSPMAAYKARRLNEARRELKAASDWGAVARVARRWGFWHPGEFAADYRRLFGERPSQTMARA